MRLLKILSIVIIVVVALTAGLLVTAAVVLGGAMVFLGRRLLGPSATTRIAPPNQGSVHFSASDGVIEVTATEVPVDRSTR